jgi:hypothetical protein
MSVCCPGPLLYCAVHEAQRLCAGVGGDVRPGVCGTEHDAAGAMGPCCCTAQYNAVQYTTAVVEIYTHYGSLQDVANSPIHAA